MTSTSTVLPGNAFLDPAVLARIGNLELLAKTVVEGFINGLHRSPHLGASTDFAEHRPYMPGDDIRRIDWRLYARTDRHYIKEYEADTNTNFRVILDVSPSMRYGASAEEGRLSKLTYACYLAACLTYFSSMQRDRVGLATIDGDIVDYIPPSAKHLQLILHSLHRTDTRQSDASSGKARAKAALLPPLRKLSESVRRRSLVVLISDFYEDVDDIINALTYLRGRGNDIIAFHLLDPRELDFSFTEASNFIDMETGERMPVIPEYLRTQYREIVKQHTAALNKRMTENRIDYSLFDTSKPLDRALFSYLLARQRFNRVR
jgi:uncharacterized protein (DUF58 family)